MHTILQQTAKTANTALLKTLKAKCRSRLVYLEAVAFWAAFVYIFAEIWRKVVE